MDGRFNDSEYAAFEKDLLTVLKNDREHRLEFDGRLIVRSSRYGCDIAAKDVHWDPGRGDLVLVGAFRSGTAVMDETKEYPVMKTEISVPLRECYEDLKRTSGEEMRLVGKARKAAIDKYLCSVVSRFEAHGLFGDGMMKLDGFDLGAFRIGRFGVSALTKDELGRIGFVCSEDGGGDSVVSASRFSLSDVQGFGRQLDMVGMGITRAKNCFARAMEKLEPRSMSYTAEEHRAHYEAAADVVRRMGFSGRIVECVLKSMAELDLRELKEKEERGRVCKVCSELLNGFQARYPDSGCRFGNVPPYSVTDIRYSVPPRPGELGSGRVSSVTIRNGRGKEMTFSGDSVDSRNRIILERENVTLKYGILDGRAEFVPKRMQRQSVQESPPKPTGMRR